MGRRRSATGGPITAGLAAAGFAAYLISSGALDPVLSGAVTLALAKVHGSGGRARSATEPGMSKVADWQYFDNRPEWSSVRGVPEVSGPTSPSAPTRPAIAPPENPIHWMFYAPAPMPHYSLAPRSSCAQPYGPGLYVQQFTVTPATASATVSWWDLGDPDAKQYQLAAVPDFVNEGDGSRTVTRPATVTTAVTPPLTCKRVTVTVTGLVSGQRYFFQLESVNTSRVQANREYGVVRAESKQVVIG